MATYNLKRLKAGLRFWCAAGAAAGLAGSACASPANPFTFAKAEFMRPDTRMQAANDFAARQLIAGLPMREAITRVERADALCRRSDKHVGDVVCRYLMPVHPEGGDLGERIWTIRLTSGASDTLRGVTIDRSLVGFSGLLPD
jgi:hypothetical protein